MGARQSNLHHGGMIPQIAPELNREILRFLPHQDFATATSTSKAARAFYNPTDIKLARQNNPIIQHLVSKQEEYNNPDAIFSFKSFLENLHLPAYKGFRLTEGPFRYDPKVMVDMVTDAVKYAVDNRLPAIIVDDLIYAYDDYATLARTSENEGSSIFSNDARKRKEKWKNRKTHLMNYIRNYYSPMPGDYIPHSGPLWQIVSG
jgi:hypothetical protein